MHPLHNEVGCLNHRVFPKRQYLRGSSVLTILGHLQLQFGMIEQVILSQIFVVRSEDYGCKMVSSGQISFVVPK